MRRELLQVYITFPVYYPFLVHFGNIPTGILHLSGKLPDYSLFLHRQEIPAITIYLFPVNIDPFK